MAEGETNLESVKKLLQEEQGYYFPHDPEVLPVLSNKDVIILQFGGWSINLYPDGKWIWEDTTGG
jgi:hypothetical protein